MEDSASQPQSSEGFKILCKDFPAEFLLDKTIAKQHFKQFGKVKRVAFKSKQRICTVTYVNRDDFVNALENAGFYSGHSFPVMEDGSPSSSKKKIVKRHSIAYIDNDEIQEELAAMGGLEVYKMPVTSSGENQAPKPAKPQVIPRLNRNRVWTKGVPKSSSSGPPTVLKPKIKEKKTIKTESVSGEQMELIRLIKSQALTVDEKYRVLDARDKLLRLKIKKNVSLISSATVGTCPDMCPEKERLMREMQHQIALYEQDEDRHIMNAKKAVKQYSRSSADQEAPLPLELRPANVLQMTMAYLMHTIMDLCDMDEINLAEWYHFLWDRTRGIRKDITQQNLCSQEAVELVEQCARFHIHCSARLVAEEPSVFDQKINTENLTKCLQTLKYMYNDLRLKGESCPHEAEFRAYIILLNISDGNFMWEVQQLRDKIQKSPEVKFALDIYSAYDKRNYVKFFKLIKSTTYLNACILMRYFVQVRVTAIQTLAKCFTPPKNTSLYPVSEIQENLHFDDFESTTDFLQTYGINTNEEQTHFILDRKSFVVPDFPYLLERSMNVEKKRQEPIGQVVCGKDLPQPLYLVHEPQNSFDKNGYIVFNDVLKETDLNLDVQVLAKDDDSSDVIFVDVQEPGYKISFGQGEEMKKTENIFKKEAAKMPESAVAQKSPMTVFGLKPFTAASTKNIFPKAEPIQSVLDQVDSSPKPSTNIFTRAAEMPTSTSIFGGPKTTTANIFGGKAEEPKTLSIFPKVGVTTAGNIFGNTNPMVQSMFGNKEEPKLTNIFGNLPAEANVFRPQEPTSQLNIFAAQKAPKSGGFTFVLPKTNTEKRIDAMKVNTSDELQAITFPTPSATQVEVKENWEKVAKKKAKEELRQLEEERRRIQEELREEIEREAIEREKQRELERLQELRKQEEERRRKEEERKRIEEQRRREELERLERIKQEQLRLKKLKEIERKRNLEIKQAVNSALNQIVEGVDTKIREETLARIRCNIQRRQLLKICRKWRNIVIKNIRKRKALDCSPFWINTKSLKQCANDLHTDAQDFTLELIKRYRSGKSVEIPLAELPDIKKIDVFNMTYNLLRKRLFDLREKCQKNIFWKLIISLPDEKEYPRGLGKLEETLANYIQWEKEESGTYYVEKFNANSCESVTYCIEKKKGLHVKQNDANSIIFISEKFDSALQLRMFENLKSLGCFVKVPITLIVQDSSNVQDYLNKLQENGIVSVYKVLLVKCFSQQSLIEAVDESILFLTQKVEKSPPLQLDTLSAFVTKHLGSEIWKKAKSYAKWSPEYAECMRDPNVVIALYNEGLKRVGKILTDKDRTEYAAFPDVFKNFLPSKEPDFLPCDFRYFPDFWKNPGYLVKIKRLLRCLELPKYKGTWPPQSKEDLFTGISKYCSTVFENPKEPFLAIYNLLMDDDGAEEILWSDAIEVLTKYKLREQNLSLEGTKLDTTVFKTFVAVYVLDKLEEFRRSDWFYRNNPVIEKFVKKIKNVVEKESKKRHIEDAEFTSEDYTEAIERAEKLLKSPKDNCVGNNREVEEINRSLDDLETSIKIMKKVNTVLRKFVE